jgi:N-terminal acetyltransferase B complex non-catalytic subunit
MLAIHQSQKELKPGDDLALLAVQQIMYQNPDDVGSRVACAVVLETAINHSPDNAYLKIAAIDVYFQLDAMSRAWEFFQAMSLKHIQLDSCIYTILPFLMQGGLYNETIELCNALLRFQAGTARDCGDYAGRAMEAGTLSKAHEFMVFQRNKMNKSLSVLEAKGLILDAASMLATVVPRQKYDNDPILKGCLGIHQGIVGGDDDVGRATQMVIEAYNPYAALSLVSWADMGGSVKDGENMADNRDMDILGNQLLYRTKTTDKETVVKDSLRRGHIHGILIRATLCLDAAKGPKKGKVVKPTEELTKRTQSLLDCADAVTKFVDTHVLEEGSNGPCSKPLVYATLHLCRVLAMVNAGLPKLESDTLEHREQYAQKILEGQALEQLKHARERISLESVKDVCQLLPNYIVPLYAVFKMCSDVCALYGWNKRKKSTKKVAGAMAKLAEEFNSFVETVLSRVER